jgi:hypothetical protein
VFVILLALARCVKRYHYCANRDISRKAVELRRIGEGALGGHPRAGKGKMALLDNVSVSAGGPMSLTRAAASLRRINYLVISAFGAI